jgi:hypothetical protein
MSPSWPPRSGPLLRPQRPPPKRKASNPPWAASLAAKRRRASSPAWWGWEEGAGGPPVITSLRRCHWGPAAMRSTWATAARWSPRRVWPAWVAWPARGTSTGEKRKSRTFLPVFLLSIHVYVLYSPFGLFRVPAIKHSFANRSSDHLVFVAGRIFRGRKQRGSAFVSLIRRVFTF